MSKKVFFVSFLIAFTHHLLAQKIAEQVIKEDIARPESAYFTNGFIYISNQDGPGMKKDSSGWINKLSEDGVLVQSHWVDGLNAPKGLGSWKNMLFTADIDRLVVIDLKTGKISRKINIPGSILLNDIVVDKNGDIYISDTMQSAIYKISNAGSENPVIELWAKNLNQAPNGLFIYKKDLYVAGWGTEIGEGFKTKELGKLYSIGLKNKKITELTEGLGNLDGIVRLEDGRWIFTASWQNALYSFNPKSKTTQLLYKSDDKNGISYNPGDIGILKKRNILMIPNAAANQVSFVNLNGL